MIERDQIRRALRRDGQRLIQRQMMGAAAAFGITPRARVIHQNQPHQLRRHCEEMRAILPAHRALPDQAQINLVDQRAGLQRVSGALPPQVAVRQAMQFLVNQRHQPVERRAIPAAPGGKQLRNFLCWLRGHADSLFREKSKV